MSPAQSGQDNLFGHNLPESRSFTIGKITISEYSKWKPAPTGNTDRVSDSDHQSAEAGLDRAWSDFKLDSVIFGDNI